MENRRNTFTVSNKTDGSTLSASSGPTCNILGLHFSNHATRTISFSFDNKNDKEGETKFIDNTNLTITLCCSARLISIAFA